MKYISKILFLGTLLAIQFACTDQGQSPSYKNGEAILQLCFEQPSSRSALNSAAPVQAVTESYLYIFEGTAESAPLVACEDLLWGKGMEQKEYRIRYNLDKTNGTEYVLMAVGLDDASKGVYKLSATPETDLTDTQLTLGTLSIEAKALAGVSESEFFVGESTVKYENGIFTQVGAESSMQYNQTPTVEMRRRVSGILLYVTDIPCDINSTKVTHLTLEVNKAQRKDLVLHRHVTTGDNTGQTSDDILDETGNTFTESAATESKTLMTIPMPSDGYVAGGTYSVAAPAATDKVQRLENTWLKGVYLLPLENVELNLNLYGENNTQLLSLPVHNEENNTQYTLHSNHIYSIGQKLTPDNTLDDVPVSLAGDKIVLRPVAWTEVLRNDTTDISKNENFFEPTDPYGLKLLTNDGKVSNFDNYIFNCIANEEGKIRIRLPKPREGQNEATWELSVSYPDAQENGEANPKNGWLYLKNGDTWKEAAGTFSGTGDIVYDLFMTDYATVPQYVINGVRIGVENYSNLIDKEVLKAKYDNDYRIAMFTLNGTNPDGSSIMQSFTVKQYNAIVLKMTGYDVYNTLSRIIYPMFSRLDVGDRFDINGNISTEGIKYEWGYHNTKNSASFGKGVFGGPSGYANQQKARYMGLNNTVRIKTVEDSSDSWDESAAAKCWKPYQAIKNNAISIADESVENLERKDNIQVGSVWYFPGAAELFFLFQLNKILGLKTSNIRQTETYWSSSPRSGDKEVFPVPADVNVALNEEQMDMVGEFEDEVSKPVDRKSGTAFYLRQASIYRVE